jgi:hypothetical protein
MLQLRSNQSQHILTTAKKLEAGGIVNIGLGLVKAFLFLQSARTQVLPIPPTYQSILLASRPVASMRLQEASIDELEVRFKRARRLIFTLRPKCKSKDHGEEHTDNTQRNSKLVKRVTRNESRKTQHSRDS